MADRDQTPQRFCHDAETVISMGGEVVSNSDGSVSVYVPNNVGTLVPIVLTKPCCEKLSDNYFFDIDQQKCMSKSSSSSCGINDVFKLVLNPKGNDGNIFYVDEGETCNLSVDFNYLFKVKCDTLSDILMNKKAGPIIDTFGSPTMLDFSQTRELRSLISEQQSLCDKYTYELEALLNEIASTPYSIECSFQYEVAEPVPTDSNLMKSFGKTAFDRNNIIAPFSLYFAKALGTFCLTEPAGLNQWKLILGDIRYQQFIDGDVNSYTCKDVQTIVDYNANVILSGGKAIINECNVPFGARTELMKQYGKTLKEQEICSAKIKNFDTELEAIQISDIIALETENSQNCETPIDFFESFSVSMTVEVVTSANTLETVYEQPLFGPIGTGNLYSYLTANTNSGFYVCGDPNISETNFNGCSPLLFDYDGSDVNNVTSCQTLMSNILDSLYEESGLSGTTDGQITFQDSLSVSALTSNWVNFSTLITNPNVLDLIKNQLIKISFKINSTCGNFCILVDEISLNKVCTKVKDTSLFITQSPGFNIERICDNKKSWLANTTPVNRVFDMKNVFGNNPIRQTNYDVNDVRLVINTKEIDLDINIASGIENDVWCYIVDNPCILSSTCTPLEASCPSGYTLNFSKTSCIYTDTKPYTLSNVMYTAFTLNSGTTNGFNGYFGGYFYEDITNRPWPIYTLTDGLSYTGVSTVVDSSSSVVNVVDTKQNTLWGGYATPPYYFWLWRQNVVGLWNTLLGGYPENEWIGFSECITIPETKTYVIALAGDDAIRVSLNGQPLIELNGAGFNWVAWRMFPITLQAGNNIFTIEGIQGLAQGGSPVSFGFEIYDVSISTLTGLTGNLFSAPNTQLDPYIIFSTKDLSGQMMNLGEASGYICPNGYTYDPCLDACVITVTAATITTGDCCDPCGKQFQDDSIYDFQDEAHVTSTLNGSNCCGDAIDFNSLMTQPLSAVTTIEDFEYFLSSELIDVKNRQTISGYPTLKALYNRYLNSLEYCGTKSSAFDYITMDQFAGLIDSYWVDIVEQVIPATTIWGSVKVYSNTLFDQQKFKYKAYTSLLCGNPYSGKTILSPINGTSGQCTNVEVISTTINLASQPNVRMKRPSSVCNTLCIAQMNMGSEFIGTVKVIDASPSDCVISDGETNVVVECPLQVSINFDYPTATAVVVGSNGSVIYEWSNGETGSTITLSSAGTYSVTVTDAACCVAEAEVNIPEPEIKACWYSVIERPEFLLDAFYCTHETSAVTFTVSSFVVNGVELITDTGYTKTITSANTNFVSASNTVLSGCGPSYTTGVTYTNYVDFVNEIFDDLGLSSYKAQLSYTNRVVYDPYGNILSPAGFYMIFPVGDTFSLRMNSNLFGTIVYHENEITSLFGVPAGYYAIVCDGVVLENGNVVE